MCTYGRKNEKKPYLRAYCPVVIIIVLGLLLIGGVSATEFGPWSLQTVASTGDVGQYSSLALNAAGNPAISYYDQTKGDLKYASWDGSQWVLTTVDYSKSESKYKLFFLEWGSARDNDSDYTKNFHGTEKVGEYSSLALDSSGKPRISYLDTGKGDLKYASWDGSRWVVTTVDGTDYVKGQKGCNWDGDHGRNEDKSINVGEYSSLALDGSGNPRISYYDQTNGDLKYASWDGSRWVITTVDSARDVGEYSSLALDGSGNPRISYYDQTNGDLKYASWDGSRWVVTTVDGTDYKKGQKGSNWDGDHGRNEDKSINVGEYSSLALDGSGNPRISYYDQTNGDLKYASWDGGRWVITTVDGARDVGEYSSLALDANSNPRISYFDATNGNLKFAGWNITTSRWVTETVDSSKRVGTYTSLALDSLGNPRISYYDQKNRDLKYAAGTGHMQNPAAPTVTGITPAGGTAGTLVPVTSLAGTNFVAGTTPAVWLAKTGANNINATNVTVVSPTQITCTLPLPPPSPTSAGQWDVVVENADGQAGSMNAAFAVTNPLLTVTGITPASGVAATTVTVTSLAGTNFMATPPPTVWLAMTEQSNVTATNVVVVSPTRITCTFPLPNPTVLGPWDVYVMNADGQSASMSAAFTVTNPAPTVTGITPAGGTAGTLVSVTSLAGTNFEVGSTTVWLAKTGQSNVTATNVTVQTSTTITCTFQLPNPSATSAGQWDLVVKNTDGQSGSMSGAFTVTNPPLAVTGIIPASGKAGTSVGTSVAGTNFIPGTTPSVWLAKTGQGNVTATNVVVVSPTQITCTFQLPNPSATSAGQWDVVVQNADGQFASDSAAFTVVDPPTVTGISPASGVAGTSVGTSVAGTNFMAGPLLPTVWLAKTGQSNVMATNIVVVSPTRITCTFQLPSATTTSLGQWDVNVVNADGQSGSMIAAFTVVYDKSPLFTMDWSAADSWAGWEHNATWVGVETGPSSEYGPVIVNGHGEHGSNISIVRGNTQSSVWKTFTAPYGTGYDNITFNGLLSDTGKSQHPMVDR